MSDDEPIHDWRYWAEQGKKAKQASKSAGPGNDAIVEIRGGAGGDEAALFAMELFTMYKKYAARKEWDFSVVDFNDTSIGGLKNATFEVSGPGAYDAMSHESGVHRVQRVPDTEKSGRVH